MIYTKTALSLVAAATLSGAASGQFQTICSESFEYPTGNLGGLAGGTGWENSWWADNNGDASLVTSPGFDTAGEKITTNLSDTGSYRVVSRDMYPALANSNDRFGVDGTAMYFAFDSQRVDDDQYGGFSLFDQGCCEVLFIGTPWQAGEIGIQDHASGGTVTTISGSDPNTLHRVVTRLDYMAGADRLRMWLDPATAHPTASPDLDLMIGDIQWNEVRFQSGQPAAGAGGFHYDNLVIDSDGLGLGTNYCVATVNSTGGAASISAAGSDSVAAADLTLSAGPVPDQFGLFYFGPSQDQVAFGDGWRCITGGFFRLQIEMAAGNTLTHVVDFGAQPALTQFASGTTWNIQAWFRDPAAGGSGFNLSDGYNMTFMP